MTRLQPASALIEQFVSEEGVSGAALAVARRGTPVATHFAGNAAPGIGTMAGPETLWPLASITKLYTAATVVSLVEQGVLALSTPVRCVLPEFDGDGREKITVRHLLTHTAGSIHEPPDMERLLIAQTPPDTMVDLLYRAPLLFAPGAGQAYSDLGYALLGRIAARVAGRSFPELMQDLVLQPAALAATHLIPAAAQIDRLAQITGPLAEETDGAMYNSAYARSLAHPAFGVVATVQDLLRFGLCFAPGGPRFLSEAAVRTMTSNQVGDRDPRVTGAVVPWGLGFELRASGFPVLASPASYGHGGASGCLLWIDPAYDAVIAFVSNRHYNVDPEGFEQRVERVLNSTLACLTRDV
jgi:CubicO group peptidase (beta-lactamase class C family)